MVGACQGSRSHGFESQCSQKTTIKTSLRGNGSVAAPRPGLQGQDSRTVGDLFFGDTRVQRCRSSPRASWRWCCGLPTTLIGLIIPRHAGQCRLALGTVTASWVAGPRRWRCEAGALWPAVCSEQGAAEPTGTRRAGPGRDRQWAVQAFGHQLWCLSGPSSNPPPCLWPLWPLIWPLGGQALTSSVQPGGGCSEKGLICLGLRETLGRLLISRPLLPAALPQPYLVGLAFPLPQ